MTADMDEMHHATLPVMKEALAEWSELHQQMRSGIAKVVPSRRGFLMGAGVALGGLALAACGSSSKSSTGAAGSTTTRRRAPRPRPAASSPATSRSSRSRLRSRTSRCRPTPPASARRPPASSAPSRPRWSRSHRPRSRTTPSTRQAWNAVLAGADKPTVTGVDKTVKDAVVDPAFAKVKDVGGLATLALDAGERGGRDLSRGDQRGLGSGRHQDRGHDRAGRAPARRDLELRARQVPGTRHLHEDGRRPARQRRHRLTSRVAGPRPRGVRNRLFTGPVEHNEPGGCRSRRPDHDRTRSERVAARHHRRARARPARSGWC